MMARPTKLDKRTQDLLLIGIRLGLTYEDAAQAAGIHASTFYRWMEKGKRAKAGKFREFCESLQRVKAESQLTFAKMIHDAAKGGQPQTETRIIEYPDGGVERTTIQKTTLPDWRAAALILERRFPDSWGRRDHLKVEVDWRKELIAIGVDPDEAVSQATEILRKLRANDSSNPLGSDEIPSV